MQPSRAAAWPVVFTVLDLCASACGGDRGSGSPFEASSAASADTQGGSDRGGSTGAGTQGSTDTDGGADSGGSTGPGTSDDAAAADDGIRFDLDPDGPTPPDTPGEHRTCGEGEFVFVVPYQLPPDPSRGTVDCAGGSVTQADVVLALDTTNSMQSFVNSIRSSFVQLVRDLGAEIPNIAFGAGGFEDFPGCGEAGSPGDIPWYLVHRVMTVSTPEGIASVENRIGAMVADNGGDGPESVHQALYEIATGQGVSQGGANVPPFDAISAPPMPIPAGESLGDIGGVGFRAGSLPIVILGTDNKGHNCEPWPDNNYTCGMTVATCDRAIEELTDIGARVIGMTPGVPPGTPAFLVADWEAIVAGAEEEMRYVVEGTGGVVPPSAWSMGAARPTGCSPDQCCTLENGAGRAPEASGQCPLVFRVGLNDVGNAIAPAIKVLAKGGSFDIGARIQDDPSDAVDAVAEFVNYIETSSSSTAPCTGAHATEDRDGDGHHDWFLNLTTGESVCFDLIPKKNLTVPATEDEQRFKAYLDIQANGVTSVGRVEVTFIVPPAEVAG